MPHVIYKGIDYPIGANETILDGLLEGGADVRYSCRRGSCHTCLLQSDPALVRRLPKNCLPETLKAAGMFLPCVTRCSFPLEVRPPDWSSCFVQGVVAKKEQLPAGIVRLVIDTPPQLQWSAGQYVYLRAPNGEARPYSIASVRALDYFLELHIQCYEAAKVSRWVANDLKTHDIVHFRGPLGDCHYKTELKQAPLLLLGTGTGAGALLAIAREAKLLGHEESIELFHGVRDPSRFYLTPELQAFQSEHPQFKFTYCCSGTTRGPDVVAGRVTNAAFSRDRVHFALFLCGLPAMVEEARGRALRHGNGDAPVYADAFEPYRP